LDFVDIFNEDSINKLLPIMSEYGNIILYKT